MYKCLPLLTCTCQIVSGYPLILPLPAEWTTSSTEAVNQLRPNVQPGHNQRLGKTISSSYEL